MMTKYMKKFALIFVVFALALSSCRKDDIETRSVPDYDRTVLVYMVANNSLNSDAYQNIRQMVSGAQQFNNIKTRYLVYLDPRYSDPSADDVGGNAPRLISITVDPMGNAQRNIIKWYPDQNSASSAVMQSVIADAFAISPSKSYGLVLWSHGMGWLPDEFVKRKQQVRTMFSVRRYPAGLIREIDYPDTKSFGQDGNNWMEVADIAAGIPDNKFEFIAFDACYMGTIEVAYALRNKANYIISSPAEILTAGFPYDRIIPCLFGKSLDLQGIADTFFDSYNTLSGDYRSATISLVKTSELEPLKDVVAEIISSNRAAVSGIPLSKVQTFNRFSFSGYYFFDLTDVVSRVATASQIQKLKDQMDKTVLYKNHTPYFLSFIEIKEFSGLSMYIPQAADQSLEAYYSTLEWYGAVWQ